MKRGIIKLLVIAFSLSVLLGVTLISSSCEKVEEDDGNGYINVVLSDVIMEKGKTYRVKYESNINGIPLWSSKNESICSVNDGVITALSEGETTVTLNIEQKSTEIKVTVAKPQEEFSSMSIPEFEVYKYIYDGELLTNDFVFTYGDYGVVPSDNMYVSVSYKGEILPAVFRKTTNNDKGIVDGSSFGSSIYGDNVSIIVYSNGKNVHIPIDFVITKNITSKDDLDNLFFYGNLDTTTPLMTYDGYFIQRQTIDLELDPLLYRSSSKIYGNYFLDEQIYVDDNFDEGRLATAITDSGLLYGYFNVDAGFLGTYDGRGNAILNVSGYNDNFGSTASIGCRAGIFGNVSRKGVVKNLEVTGSDTWSYFNYSRINFLSSTFNGTMIDVHITVKGNEYISSTSKPNVCGNVCPLAWCLSGATLTDVVVEYDCVDLAPVIFNHKADKEIFYSAYYGLLYQEIDGKCIARGDEVEYSPDAIYIPGEDTNTYKNCYFIYTKVDGISLSYTADPNWPRPHGHFECYSYDNLPDQSSFVFENSDMWTIINGVPAFKEII